MLPGADTSPWLCRSAVVRARRLRCGLRLTADDRGWLLDPDPDARVDLVLEETAGEADVWMRAVCDLCVHGHVGEFADAAAFPSTTFDPCEACGNESIPLRVVPTPPQGGVRTHADLEDAS